MTNKLIIPLFCILFSCSSNKTGEQNVLLEDHNQKLYEDYIVQQIATISEVKNYKIPFSENETPVEMQYIIQLRPQNGEEFYWIEVGYQDEDYFQSCFNFYFYSADSTVKYLDKNLNRVLTLEEWRSNKEQVQPFMHEETMSDL